MTDPGKILARADERLRRLATTPAARAAAMRRRQRQIGRLGRRLARMVGALVVIGLALLAYAFIVGPIGTDGLILAVIVAAILLFILSIWPRWNAVSTDDIATADPATLPARVDDWLDRQRRVLPLTATPVLDAISARLSALEPQLALVDGRDLLAQDLNRLLGRHLPELVERYRRIPEDQRSRSRGSKDPSIDRQLLDGLVRIEGELGRVSDQLAAEHRDAFLTQGRFLEQRYGDQDGIDR